MTNFLGKNITVKRLTTWYLCFEAKILDIDSEMTYEMMAIPNASRKTDLSSQVSMKGT